jgi:hypothetical protein
VRTLLCGKADPTGSRNDVPVLLLAARNGHPGCLRLLLAAKANPAMNRGDYFHSSALHVAVAKDHEECVATLLLATRGCFSTKVSSTGSECWPVRWGRGVADVEQEGDRDGGKEDDDDEKEEQVAVADREGRGKEEVGRTVEGGKYNGPGALPAFVNLCFPRLDGDGCTPLDLALVAEDGPRMRRIQRMLRAAGGVVHSYPYWERAGDHHSLQY